MVLLPNIYSVVISFLIIAHSNLLFSLAGSTDESWYDSAAVLESDCSEEDFQSVLDGTFVYILFPVNM